MRIYSKQKNQTLDEAEMTNKSGQKKIYFKLAFFAVVVVSFIFVLIFLFSNLFEIKKINFVGVPQNESDLIASAIYMDQKPVLLGFIPRDKIFFTDERWILDNIKKTIVNVKSIDKTINSSSELTYQIQTYYPAFSVGNGEYLSKSGQRFLSNINYETIPVLALVLHDIATATPFVSQKSINSFNETLPDGMMIEKNINTQIAATQTVMLSVENITNLYETCYQLKKIFQPVVRVEIDPYENIVYILKNGLAVRSKLSRDKNDVWAKLGSIQDLAEIKPALKSTTSNLSYIDLRFGNKVFYKAVIKATQTIKNSSTSDHKSDVKPQ